MREARGAACLRNPHIVPVYDVGHTDNGLCYLVSKFIEGSDLTRETQETRLAACRAAGTWMPVGDWRMTRFAARSMTRWAGACRETPEGAGPAGAGWAATG